MSASVPIATMEALSSEEMFTAISFSMTKENRLAKEKKAAPTTSTAKENVSSHNRSRNDDAVESSEYISKPRKRKITEMIVKSQAVSSEGREHRTGVTSIESPVTNAKAIPSNGANPDPYLNAVSSNKRKALSASASNFLAMGDVQYASGYPSVAAASSSDNCNYGDDEVYASAQTALKIASPSSKENASNKMVPKRRDSKQPKAPVPKNLSTSLASTTESLLRCC
ncbi:MAG: hypothetical protein SGILL_009465 [Bacillariaceae sp.]